MLTVSIIVFVLTLGDITRWGRRRVVLANFLAVHMAAVLLTFSYKRYKR